MAAAKKSAKKAVKKKAAAVKKTPAAKKAGKTFAPADPGLMRALEGDSRAAVFLQNGKTAFVNAAYAKRFGARDFMSLLNEHSREHMRVAKVQKSANLFSAPLLLNNKKEVSAELTFWPLTGGFLVRIGEENEGGGITNIDHLTGFFNRGEGERLLDMEWKRSRRRGEEFGLAVLDLDRFKSVNDNYGHDVGDSVLQHVAAALRSRLRVGDWAARWGGEEFIVCFAAMRNEKDLPPPMERLRMGVERAPFAGPPRLAITVSMGGVTSHGFKDAAQMLKEADALLYESKNSGRNRITTYSKQGLREAMSREGIVALLRRGDLRARYAGIAHWNGALWAGLAQPVIVGEKNSSHRTAAYLGQRAEASAARNSLMPAFEEALWRRALDDWRAYPDSRLVAPLSLDSLRQNSAMSAIAREWGRAAAARGRAPEVLALIGSRDLLEAPAAAVRKLADEKIPVALRDVDLDHLPLGAMARLKVEALMLSRWRQRENPLAVQNAIKAMLPNAALFCAAPVLLQKERALWLKIGAQGCRTTADPLAISALKFNGGKAQKPAAKPARAKKAKAKKSARKR